MKDEFSPFIGWSFVWKIEDPYITNISSYSRRDLIKIVEKEFDMNWKSIYRLGGRAIKTVTTIRA